MTGQELIQWIVDNDALELRVASPDGYNIQPKVETLGGDIAAGGTNEDEKVLIIDFADDFDFDPTDEFEPMGDPLPDSCPGCGKNPGDGLTDGCNHPDGCGFWRQFN